MAMKVLEFDSRDTEKLDETDLKRLEGARATKREEEKKMRMEMIWWGYILTPTHHYTTVAKVIRDTRRDSRNKRQWSRSKGIQTKRCIQKD